MTLLPTFYNFQSVSLFWLKDRKIQQLFTQNLHLFSNLNFKEQVNFIILHFSLNIV